MMILQYPSLSCRKDIHMWLDNLKELKTMTGMTSKAIAEDTSLPERTVARIFSGETDNPRVDTIIRIVTALGGSLDDIFVDTKAVIATENLVEVKETANIVEAQRDLVAAENEILKAKVAALTAEIDLLNKELNHKDEILALHKYYQTQIEQLTKREVRTE